MSDTDEPKTRFVIAITIPAGEPCPLQPGMVLQLPPPYDGESVTIVDVTTEDPGLKDA